MGKSRSATIVIAYLMASYHMSPSQALKQLCEGRPVCAPNPGFMEQLEIYHQILHAKQSEQKKAIYRAWAQNKFRGSSWEWDKREKL